MKKIIPGIAIATFFLLMACKDTIDMTTTVNSNGSCDRMLVATVEESFIQGDTANHPFVMGLSGWDIKWQYKDETIRANWPVKGWKKDSQDSAEAITAIAHKHYNSVQQMADSFRIKPSHAWSGILIKPTLGKRFRFFYTYYDYKESFSKLPITPTVPADRYLSTEEAGYWLTGKPDILKGMNGVEAKDALNSIEEKAEKWILHNLFEMQYNELLRHLESIAGHPPKATMDARKDSIFALYYDKHAKDPTETGLLPILDTSFNTRVFGDFAKSGNDSLVKKINEPEAFERLSNYFNISIEYKLVMPGDIIASDGILSHDTLSWRINGYRLLNGDYTVVAASRKTNLWAFFIAALIATAAIILFFIKKK